MNGTQTAWVLIIAILSLLAAFKWWLEYLRYRQ